MKPSVFIGSSSERVAVADAIEVNLSPIAEVTNWKHAFRPGRSFFQEVIHSARKCDFAVVVLTPDDVVVSRDIRYNSTRDNLLFELGLFIGEMGQDRVFAILDESIDTKILSDYGGISILRYNGQRSDRNLRQAVSPACVEIRGIIETLGLRTPHQPNHQTTMSSDTAHFIGLRTVYPNYSAAESFLLDDMRKSAGPIRLFFQIASQSINAKRTLFDTISEIAQKAEVELRVLHAGADSPLFSRDRLAALGKNPDRVLRSLRHVEEALRSLEAATTSTLLRRTHDCPFIWRLYGFSESLYLMPYFEEKNAAAVSPVLVFTKGPRSMYNAFTDWFDYTWAKAAPKSISLKDIITPATPCGTALLLSWGEFHVFGIPKRDLVDGSEYVRFSGLGGKRKNASESLEDCALREGNEESGGTIAGLVSAPSTHFFRADGVLDKIELIADGLKPRLLFEKNLHTVLGTVRSEDDYYYMVAYAAEFTSKPTPSNEIAALLFLNDRHLDMLSRRNDVTLGQLEAAGAEIVEQGGHTVKKRKILVPHGTASFLIRLRSRSH